MTGMEWNSISNREKKYDFSHSYYDSGLQIATNREARPNLEFIYQPFSLSVWGILVLIVIILAHILWMLQKWTSLKDFFYF